jgi:hypothetical protein
MAGFGAVVELPHDPESGRAGARSRPRVATLRQSVGWPQTGSSLLPMTELTLTPAQRAALDSLSTEDIRRHLSYVGPGTGTVVPGIADGMIPRSEVLA